jgi:hypothetical protein
MPARKKTAPPAQPSRRRSGAAQAKSEDVAAQLERVHAEVTAAIAAGQANVEDAMKQAEIAVAHAVSGVAKVVRQVQQG